MTREDSDLLDPERRKRARITTFWRTAHQEAWHDLTTRWRHGLFWTFCLFVFVGLVLSLALVLKLSENAILDGMTACRPDGAFSLAPYNYKYWDSSGFFQITLAFGTLSFTQAKVIDVAWDFVIGRGGQALLALTSWHVFARYVTTSMAVAPITFGTFRTVFLQQEASVVSIPRLVRDFSRRRGLHSRAAMVFMVATLAFILVFPTFGSAMTGYSANVKSYVRDIQGNYLPFNTFNYAFYMIHDGSRIGLEDFKMVALPPITINEALLVSGDWLDACDLVHMVKGTYRKECDLLRATTMYAGRYGPTPSGEKNETRFAKITLQGLSLNITAFYIPKYYVNENFNFLREGDKSPLNPMWGDVGRMAWAANNQTFNKTYIQENGICQAQTTYQWGFSFIQLIVMITFLLIWMMGLYSMYLRSYFTMQNQGHKVVAGENQAVLQLASAMQSQLNLQLEEAGSSAVSILTEEQLRLRITKDLNGGSVSLQPSSILDGGSDINIKTSFDTRRAPSLFKTWLRTEIWWLISLVLAFVGVCYSIMVTRLYLLTLLLPLEVPFAMYVSQSRRSRWILLFYLFWLFCLRGVVPAFVSLVSVQSGFAPTTVVRGSIPN